MNTIPPLSDWLPPALVGLTFTTMGLLKIYGRIRGIVGGGGKPASRRMCGSCPSWSRSVNIGAICVILGIGLYHLALLAALILGIH